MDEKIEKKGLKMESAIALEIEVTQSYLRNFDEHEVKLPTSVNGIKT